MADSKSILILMGSNAEKFDLQQSIHWSSATLERCNLVYTNGHNNNQQNYIVHVDQMPEELLTCSAGAAHRALPAVCAAEARDPPRDWEPREQFLGPKKYLIL